MAGAPMCTPCQPCIHIEGGGDLVVDVGELLLLLDLKYQDQVVVG